MFIVQIFLDDSSCVVVNIPLQKTFWFFFFLFERTTLIVCANSLKFNVKPAIYRKILCRSYSRLSFVWKKTIKFQGSHHKKNNQIAKILKKTSQRVSILNFQTSKIRRICCADCSTERKANKAGFGLLHSILLHLLHIHISEHTIMANASVYSVDDNGVLAVEEKGIFYSSCFLLLLLLLLTYILFILSWDQPKIELAFFKWMLSIVIFFSASLKWSPVRNIGNTI